MKAKKEFKYFTIVDHQKEEEYLREMHKSGWKFQKVNGLGMYHFEECEPEDVIYQLDYNQDGIAHHEEYVKMFQDCGWEYMQEYVGYSYFRKPASQTNGKEEIFCDDESRLEMMQRVFKGRIVPLIVLFSAVLVPQFFLNLLSIRNYPLTIMYGIIILLYLVLFGVFAVKLNRYKNSMKK